MQVEVLHIGNEREPVVIMDGFTEGNVDKLIDHAMRQTFARTSPYFPGPRAKGPMEVLRHRMGDIAYAGRNVFGVESVDILAHEYSLVTSRPEELQPLQRLPHFDGLAHQLALLLYLRPAGQGGTAFFRQRATGFETVTESRMESYEAELQRALDTHGLPTGYTVGSSDIFEEILRVDAVPDRAVLYRGHTLHSGVISDPSRITADPMEARLTLNTFFKVVA